MIVAILVLSYTQIPQPCTAENARHTTELLNVLHVLGRLVALKPAQADLLDRICAGPTIDAPALRAE